RRCVGRGPLDRVATPGVGRRCGNITGLAVRRRVGDADGPARFGGDAVDAVAPQRRHRVRLAAGGGAFHPVGQGQALERDGGKRHVSGSAVAGAGDRSQPQGRVAAVTGGGELVGERPGVDRLVSAADENGRVDLREALTAPEGRRVAVLALRAGGAVAVEGDVGPVLRVRLVEGAAVGQAAFGLREIRLGRGLGVEVVGAQAVVDALAVPAPGVGGRGGGTGRRIDVASVVVGLLGPVVRHGVAVRIDDRVQVPAPCLLAPGVLERRRVAGLSGLVAVNGHGPGGVGLLLAGGPACGTVVAEEVPGAVRGGHTPVLTVVVPVRPRRARELLDLGAVVVLEVPLTAGAVLDQDVGLTIEVDAVVRLLPAQVTDLGGGVAALLVVGAGDLLARDVSRLHGPAVALAVG